MGCFRLLQSALGDQAKQQIVETHIRRLLEEIPFKDLLRLADDAKVSLLPAGVLVEVLAVAAKPGDASSDLVMRGVVDRCTDDMKAKFLRDVGMNVITDTPRMDEFFKAFMVRKCICAAAPIQLSMPIGRIRHPAYPCTTA
jgi:hypothetical protein